MSGHRSSSATHQHIIEALARPPRVETLGPYAARFIHALRLIALHERAGRDPVPELAARLGSVEVAAKSLILAQAITTTWPENVHVSRFCCRVLSHDEATIGTIIDAAATGHRQGCERALDGLVRPDRAHRLWECALALVAAEMRAA
ncbi:DNA-directed RNA polymerase subunit beta' [Erythrobacter dokdonensis]|jgi:hypothetical protein|uniref:DNA-directed RNA polymerase beta subunit n=1 Tax=Erythrobacter dokdonensis DSW-74 TaxID=1300349 RepID=A0A1A7BFP3_9SPHN|nr:DNA-directed RNA polymerase subunit beta' [Erythrobacter dokdonensis]MEE4315605.1 DNA-directed RNA polymerase subunit beta' [Erythrobacter sp.]OBV10227.1 DNA-directed RNA polymerase beta subunit [Erythrobacter dokdonensis DSW-74]